MAQGVKGFLEARTCPFGGRSIGSVFVLGSQFRGVARSEQGANGLGVLSIDI